MKLRWYFLALVVGYLVGAWSERRGE